MTTKKKGRPQGSENRQYELARLEPTRCAGCGSTEREKYFRTTADPYAGLEADGRPYTHVVRRFTRCTACGQPRIDLSHENRPPGQSPGPGADQAEGALEPDPAAASHSR